MASNSSQQADPLLYLRDAIAASKPPISTTSPDPTSTPDAQSNLAIATHLQFNHNGHRSFALNTPTRFTSSGNAVDLRSIYFAYLKKDDSVTDYISSTQRLNQELSAPGGAGGKIQNLVFAEKLDLVTWLEGQSDDSEYIKPLASDAIAVQAASSAQIAAGAASGATPAPGGAPGARALKTVDPRLMEIYNGERKMGDRNSVLRGIKPTDFSHVRKIAATLLRDRHRQGHAPPTSSLNVANNPALVANRSKPTNRRIEPIILLSPSASSLLRMSNVKSFLDEGVYVPADSSSNSFTTTANILHIMRLMPSIDTSRPMRFILVDTPDQFKPDYWSRVVAVFTTGQLWQFKSYKWTQPSELFGHAMGMYVGWRDEDIPPNVRGWGRGVMTTQIDKYSPHQSASSRWRDREVVESIWVTLERFMKAKGWTKDGPMIR